MLSQEIGGAADQTPPSALTKRLNLIGLTITGVWLLLMFSYALAVRNNLLAMKPNEFGDLLAGIFAPLAFLWLVLGFFQQGEELRHSSRALWLQGEELRNSVEQQRQLVETTREQLQFEREILGHERAEIARMSAPMLQLSAGGHASNGEGKRKYEFRLTNIGKRCTGLRLLFVSTDNMVSNMRWDSLDTGHTNNFGITLPSQEDRDFTVIIEYLDERMLPGSSNFFVKKRGNQFQIDPR